MVAYAPYDDPQIAVAVVLPNLSSEKGEYNLSLIKSIITAYFDTDTKDNQ